ncbi:MAG TPA: hypothetical protein VJ583_04985 [Nitrososphaeraceae archaeon]|nr:hypothetical protein [Nitrososphaeraceae archaeon]
MNNLLEKKKDVKIFSVVVVSIIIGSMLMIAGPLTTKLVYAQQVEPGSVLKLYAANIPIDIPLIKGYVNGKEMYVIATDVSDKETADAITNKTGFKANVAPVLLQTPTDILAQAYVFKNGIKGDGLFGFQSPVLSAKPGDKGYSPLYQIYNVEWGNPENAQELKSVDEILAAEQNGQLKIEKTSIVVNKPSVKWDGGQLMIKEGEINDETTYGEGQVTKIDIENMAVTFVAHRGWGHDGSTIYYIVTDAVPEMPANMMGVVFAPFDEKLATTPVAVDLTQFSNGINGTGPMGFQPGIGHAGPTNENYSPMWRINFAEWNDPTQAKLLETLADLNDAQTKGLLTITPAMEGKHVVNCPFFGQQTVLKHMSKQ